MLRNTLVERVWCNRLPLINSRTLLIGIDGADYGLIRSWANEGKLSTLRRIIKQGAYGKLKTTMPPQSAIAWVSAFTGKNAGKHGIFHFADLNIQEKLQFNSAQDIKSKTIWELLSDKEKKIILVNIPFSYPLQRTNGIIIPGFMTSSTWMKVTLPEGLKQKLSQMNYEAEMTGEEYFYLFLKNKRKLLQRLFEIAEKKTELVIHLIKNHPWDTFAVVFTILDRIQHSFWGYADQDSPFYNSNDEKRNYIFESYQKIDDLLGKILLNIDEKTTLVILSDHGFGPIHKYFFTNTWLSKQKLLKQKEGPTRFKTALLSLIFRENMIRRVFSLIPDKGTLSKRVIKWGLEFFNYESVSYASSDVKFSDTKVYCPANYGFLRVNLKGRDLMGIVDPQTEFEQLREFLIKNLYDLVTSDTKEKVVKRVYRGEELYWGPYVKDGPDLVFETYEKFFPISLLTSKELFKTVKEMGSGNHRDNGFIGLLGPEIEKGKEIEGSHIMDVAPTILYLQGCPIPPDMDGKVLTNAFSKKFLDEHPIQHGTTSQVSKRDTPFKYTKEEEEEVKSRLRALGYI